MPLFVREAELPDEPLVRLPPAPRPPLAVRRTPETTRSRATGQPSSRATAPRLAFTDDASSAVGSAAAAENTHQSSAQGHPVCVSSARRVSAALLDHAILLLIDFVVVYLTLQMAPVAVHDWRALPPLPLLTFLALVKLAYFWTFTAAGGQTIGKMATRIRVVTADDGRVGLARALQRTLAGCVSLTTLGVGFLPALAGVDRRALHDRVAGTRVVPMPTA